MKILTVSGNTFTYGGRLYKIKWPDARDQIIAQGGEVSANITKHVDCFVEGAGAGSKTDRARMRGATIIDEVQFLELLEQGSLEVDDSGPIDQDFDLGAAVAELRGAFDGPPTSAAWTSVLDTIERCDAERMPMLLEYVGSFIKRWDDKKMSSWEPDRSAPIMSFTPRHWELGLFEDELRVAPPMWVVDMANKRYHAKHVVPRALNLYNMRLNGTLGSNVLGNPHLGPLTHLDLGWSNRYSGGFYDTLRTSEVMRRVRVLVIPGSVFTLGHKEGLRGEHTFESLERVTFVDYDAGWRRDQWLVDQLDGLACFEGVEVDYLDPAFS
ncbi:MAG: hypothetical protein AAGI01_06150 [Myxococcota bacterium]